MSQMSQELEDQKFPLYALAEIVRVTVRSRIPAMMENICRDNELWAKFTRTKAPPRKVTYYIVH